MSSLPSPSEPGPPEPEPTPASTPAGHAPAARRWVRWLWIGGGVLGVLAVSAVVAISLVIAHYSEGLPSVEKLKSGYDPPQVSRIFAADGTLLSSVFRERRTVVLFEEIPDAAKLAFLAAEDARFYEHEGLNYLGILRALWANVRAGRTVQGGSTITQQVVKNILLDQQRTFRRKVREMILTRRLEQHLTKHEIFNLYLNHIYLGHGRYGIEEASRFYFGKHAAQIDAAEAALLAGLVASPERYSPRRAAARALARRKYVLEQMLAKGFVTPDYFARLVDAPLVLAPEVDAQSALSPEAVEIAKQVIGKVQGEQGNQGGYAVTTTIVPELQVAARKAIRDALSEYERRHKLHPPYTSRAIKAWGEPFEGKPAAHRVYVGVVRGSDDRTGRIDVRVGDVVGQLNLTEEDRYNPKRLPPSEFASEGSVLRVRMLEAPDGEHAPRLRLELGPQAALVAIDVRTRDVVALVGSYEALPGGLDRTRRARRQPGSAFKPIVFAHALHERLVTPASVLHLTRRGRGMMSDEPPFRISVRSALAHSNNEAAELLLRASGPEQVVAFARELGIESKLGSDLSLALGAYEVTPIEMANAFATFASGGDYEEPRFIAELRSPSGELIPLPPRPERRRVLQPEEAYLITSLMQSVVQEGTGKQALAVEQAVAGKTGTTNDVKDAWFVGYSTEISVAVWVGFDDGLPLGDRESGTRTALPAFVDFMKSAHGGHPRAEFPRPTGILSASIDPKSGLLPRPDQAGVLEVFIDGTVPEILAPEPPPDIAAEMTYKPQPGDLNELPP